MPVDDVLLDTEMNMDKAVEHLHHELRSIRTGRASPALVEHVSVDYFGAPTPLKNIASISVPEATQLLIKPFNPGDLGAIQKAFNDSKLGLSPQAEGKALRLILPMMSTERRNQLVAQCKDIGERAKVSIRNSRRDGNKLIDAEQKDGGLTEDDADRGKADVQELTKKYEAQVEEAIDKKRADVMQV